MEKTTVYQTITLLSNSETVSKQRECARRLEVVTATLISRLKTPLKQCILSLQHMSYIFNINQMFCPAADLCVFLHFINWHTPWLDLFCLYLYIVYLDSLLGFVIFKKLLLEIHEMSWHSETTPDTLKAHDI